MCAMRPRAWGVRAVVNCGDQGGGGAGVAGGSRGRGGGRIGEAIVDRPRLPGSGRDCSSKTVPDRPQPPAPTPPWSKAVNASCRDPRDETARTGGSRGGELRRPRGGGTGVAGGSRGRGGERIGEAIVDRPRLPGSGRDCSP